MATDSIPVIDISLISPDQSPTEEDWNKISEEIDKVLSTIGFVYLKNHGVSQEIVDAALEASRHFFKLPTETKKKYSKNIETNYGYFGPNEESIIASSTEIRETFDTPLNTRQEGSTDPIPEAPGFFSAIKAISMECHPLIGNLHQIFARALKLEDLDYFRKVSQVFKDPATPSFSTFRTSHYPPVTGELVPGTVRISPHSDLGMVTLLFQDSVGGLEVQKADGTWIPATPIPGTILVNTGDLLQFWSGGRYPATVHRVLVPEAEVKKRVSRQSLIFFVHPDKDAQISPIGLQAEAAGLTGQPPITASEYARKKLQVITSQSKR